MRTYSNALERLTEAGLRPTRQRLALAKLLLEKGPRHLTAEELYHEAHDAGIAVSLATVYNTLHQFTSVGLLREVVVDMGQSYFDTNTSHHHHFFDEGSRSADRHSRGRRRDRPPAKPAERIGDRARRGHRPAARGPLTQRPAGSLLTQGFVRQDAPDLGALQPATPSFDLDPAPVCRRNRAAGRSRRARPVARSAPPGPASVAAPGPRSATRTVRWLDSRLPWIQPKSPSCRRTLRQVSNSWTISTGRPSRVRIQAIG